MTGERYVITRDIRDAVRGCEPEVLDAIVEGCRAGRPHVRCPYPDHTDNRPSWRWDQSKARAFCTCIEGSHSIFDVVARIQSGGFEAAKLRVAELLKRLDLIRDRRRKKDRRGGGVKTPEQPSNDASVPENTSGSKSLTVESANATPRNGATPAGCTLAALAAAKQLPIPFLQSLGLREVTYLGAPAIRIPYFAAERGPEPAIRFRVALTGPDHYRWRNGSRARLYGLARLADAHKAGSVTLVEGETDCFTLWSAGFPALGLPGATNWKEDRDAPLLDGVAKIYVVIEPDRGGNQVLSWLAKSHIRDRVRLVRLDGFKDPSALYLDAPERFAPRWQATLDAAEPYAAIVEREIGAQANEARRAAGDLIAEPEILDRFVAEVRRAGLVGEDRNAKIIYLALTTRLFDRPVSIAVKGPSSGGKSFTVETVLKFFPPAAYFERTAMSDRALAYSDEDFRHKHLVIYEAAGMTSDIASYLIRSLLSEGRIRYELVEKTKEGIKPRLIEKSGPTGLIVTTTATKLHPENETRLLSLAIKDTMEQTKAILHALARGNRTEAAGQFGPWHAFQKWLEVAERRVVVPFADSLADLVPPVAVRLRRDFRLLLTLIEAHALLHRERRDKDEQERIVATLDDYAAVRKLVVDLFAEGLEATVKPETREVVAIVEALGKDEVSVTEIAKALRLDKGAASRRVAVAISRGYLANNEIRRGRPGRIALSEPMPAEIEILPTSDGLGDCCAVAALQEGIGTPSPRSYGGLELAEVEI